MLQRNIRIPQPFSAVTSFEPWGHFASAINLAKFQLNCSGVMD